MVTGEVEKFLHRWSDPEICMKNIHRSVYNMLQTYSNVYGIHRHSLYIIQYSLTF